MGFGVRWVHDTRRQLINPRQGHWWELACRFHPDLPDNNPKYSQWNLDCRQYFPLRYKFPSRGPGDDVLWASRFFLHGAGKGVSFREMPALGGDNLLRGYFRGYARNLNLWAVENELRGMWGKHLGWNLYLGAGQIGETWKSVVTQSPMHSWGFGIRLLPNPAAGTLLRMDYARTANGQTGVYFEVNEAF
jgi:outer membrane protein assembly factor BamA